ncbi:unnamed protein product [Effrenium voratum]|nr:unnamed protein product [Effrenium voratum]
MFLFFCFVVLVSFGSLAEARGVLKNRKNTCGSSLAEVSIWDVGGDPRIRSLWRHYYESTNALIFVVDSSDRERIREARDELHKSLRNQHLANLTILVFANKQDLPGSLARAELEEALELEALGRRYRVQPSVASTGDGILEGYDWLCRSLTEHETLQT